MFVAQDSPIVAPFINGRYEQAHGDRYRQPDHRLYPERRWVCSAGNYEERHDHVSAYQDREIGREVVGRVDGIVGAAHLAWRANLRISSEQASLATIGAAACQSTHNSHTDGLLCLHR